MIISTCTIVLVMMSFIVLVLTILLMVSEMRLAVMKEEISEEWV